MFTRVTWHEVLPGVFVSVEFLSTLSTHNDQVAENFSSRMQSAVLGMINEQSVCWLECFRGVMLGLLKHICLRTNREMSSRGFH